MHIYDFFDADEPEVKKYKHLTKDYLLDALNYRKLGRFEKALACIEECLKRYPQDKAAQLHFEYLQKLMIHAPKGDWDGSRSWSTK